MHRASKLPLLYIAVFCCTTSLTTTLLLMSATSGTIHVDHLASGILRADVTIDLRTICQGREAFVGSKTPCCSSSCDEDLYSGQGTVASNKTVSKESSNISTSEMIIISQRSPDEKNRISTTVLDYLKWHARTRQTLNTTNWGGFRYLIVRCPKNGAICGGASDRLDAVPGLLFIAAKTKRLLFVHWEKPAALTEFLVPPPVTDDPSDSLDWRLPDFLKDQINWTLAPRIDGPQKLLRDFEKYKALRVISMPRTRGIRAYMAQEYIGDYRAVWNRLFVPTYPIQDAMAEALSELGLQVNNYIAVHYRSKYSTDQTRNYSLIRNSVNCGMELATLLNDSSLPLFFASDSLQVSRFAQEYQPSKVIIRNSSKEPMHLDRDMDYLKRGSEIWKTLSPSAYYDVFVDLFLLAGARCVISGVGSYGNWARRLSGELRGCGLLESYLSKTCQSMQVTTTFESSM